MTIDNGDRIYKDKLQLKTKEVEVKGEGYMEVYCKDKTSSTRQCGKIKKVWRCRKKLSYFCYSHWNLCLVKLFISWFELKHHYDKILMTVYAYEV